jgi:hypothetical protein
MVSAKRMGSVYAFNIDNKPERISKPGTAVIVILSAAKNLGILGTIDPSLRSG